MIFDNGREGHTVHESKPIGLDDVGMVAIFWSEKQPLGGVSIQTAFAEIEKAVAETIKRDDRQV